MGKTSGEPVERERVVRKTGASRRMGTVIGGMMGDGHVSSNKGIGEQGRGDQEPIEPRGLGMGRGGVSGQVKPGERRVGDFGDRELPSRPLAKIKCSICSYQLNL